MNEIKFHTTKLHEIYFLTKIRETVLIYPQIQKSRNFGSWTMARLVKLRLIMKEIFKNNVALWNLKIFRAVWSQCDIISCVISSRAEKIVGECGVSGKALPSTLDWRVNRASVPKTLSRQIPAESPYYWDTPSSSQDFEKFRWELHLGGKPGNSRVRVNTAVLPG